MNEREREIIMAQRKAYIAGLKREGCQVGEGCGQCEVLAAHAYPLPPVTRRREVPLPASHYAYRVNAQGNGFESRYFPDGVWFDVTITPEQVRLLADLIAHPDEEVTE